MTGDGSVALSNARHERFAHLVAGGVPAGTAYSVVGYAKRGATANAARLIAKDSVAARVRWIVDERARAAVSVATCDAKRIQSELEAVAFSDPLNYFDDRLCLRPLDQVPASARAAVASVKVRRERNTYREDANSELVELRFWNKLDALRELREHMGLNRKQGDGEPLPGDDDIEVRVVVERRVRT